MYYNNKKLALSVFWVIVGVTLIVLTFIEVLPPAFYSGMGGALTAVGALQIARNLRYRSDETYREKLDVEMKDERNSFLRLKSWSWAGYLTVLLEACGVIVAQIAGQDTVMKVLSYSVCLILLLYWVAYLVLKRKY